MRAEIFTRWDYVQPLKQKRASTENIFEKEVQNFIALVSRH